MIEELFVTILSILLDNSIENIENKRIHKPLAIVIISVIILFSTVVLAFIIYLGFIIINKNLLVALFVWMVALLLISFIIKKTATIYKRMKKGCNN